jgi:lipopolysaccharide transport system ATP-binding protein
MSEIVIKVEDLGKLYRLGEIGTGTLSHDLNRWWARVRGKEDPFAKIGDENDRTKKGNSDYVWALKDASFEVKQGEVLGIIGRNGAGKSTLLKILSKVTRPTTGSIKVKGRIASLLEVGTGFHPELTGRENIFLNGAILGMTKKEIQKKFDEIVDFAGVERYIDTPVKRYSSGMYVRLAFAVAAFLEPEILIVDEVLAVGDAEFQKKCLGRMKDVSKNEGRTVLFVSHSMPAIKNLCNSAVLMKNGKIVKEGTSQSVVDYYMTHFAVFNSASYVDLTKYHRRNNYTREIEYKRLEFETPSENNYYAVQDNISLIATLQAKSSFNKFRIALSIFTLDDVCVGTFFSDDLLSIKAGETKKVNICLKNHQLSKGQYYFSLSVGIGNEVEGIRDFDIVEQTLFFEIAYKDTNHEEVIALWHSQWGNINFHNFEIKEIAL